MSEYSDAFSSSLRDYSLDVRYIPDLVFELGVKASEESFDIAPDLAGPILLRVDAMKKIIVCYNKLTSEMISGVREIVEEYSEIFDAEEHSVINELLNSVMEHPEFLDKLLKILVKISEAFFRWLVEIGPVFPVSIA